MSGTPPASPTIEIVPVLDGRTLDRFIRLPPSLYRGDPNYVPPLLSERRAAFSAKGNPFFGHADVALWLATSGGKDVGRISAQQDHLLEDKEVGHFGSIAAIDDPAVFAALFAAAEAWLRKRGVSRAQGPFTLSINEESGALVDGFDTPPMLMMPHDPPYLDGMLRTLGYAKIRDLLAYLCDDKADLPASSAAIVARGLPKRMTLRCLTRASLAEDIASLVDIFNDAWRDHWGFVPITREEVAHMARAMKPLLHDRLVWFADVDGKPAAFGLCLPNLNEAIRDLDGRLFPFGWAKLLWRLKRSRISTGRVPLMGVRREFDGTMLGRLMPLHIVHAMRREAAAMGMRAIEVSWVLEDNLPMRHLAEASGGRAYKTYRVYDKSLAE